MKEVFGALLVELDGETRSHLLGSFASESEANEFVSEFYSDAYDNSVSCRVEIILLDNE